jgi:hypothetical protein
MPFKKVGNDDYTSPSGRHFDGAQVRLFYANGGKFPGQKGKGEAMKGYAKGGDVRDAAYATGGAVLGRAKDFMKAPNQFTDTNDEADSNARGPSRYQSKYAKSGANSGEPNPKAAAKSSKDKWRGASGPQSKGGTSDPSDGHYSKR